MSDSNKNRLGDAELDADLGRLGDEDKGDPKPARVGPAEAPGANVDAGAAAAPGDVERETVGGDVARRSSVEGVDEAAAERDAIRDRTS